MKKIILLLALVTLSCAPQPEEISDAEIIETVEGFFDALDVENTDSDLLNKYVTDDFVIYDVGRRMDKQEFSDFVSNLTALKSEWKLSEFKISKDVNSAHASFLNSGEFIMQKDSITLKRSLNWMESAYLVREADQLKIKFFSSENVSSKTDTIQ